MFISSALYWSNRQLKARIRTRVARWNGLHSPRRRRIIVAAFSNDLAIGFHIVVASDGLGSNRGLT